MKALVLPFLTVACGAGLAAADEDAVKKEIANLQGTWKFVDFQGPNADQAKELKGHGILVVTGNKMLFFLGKLKQGEGTFTVDPSKKPKHLDVTALDGPNKGMTLPAIYELAGDTLKLASFDDPKNRPKEFKYAAGDTGGLATLKRQPK